VVDPVVEGVMCTGTITAGSRFAAVVEDLAGNARSAAMTGALLTLL